MKNLNAPSELIEKIRACHVCSDLPLGLRPILQFAPSSKILIVGQAPGRITHNKGIPFDDPSGDRLRSWMGIDKDVFYDAHKVAIVPMGFCFPGTGKGWDLPPRTECAATWRNQVLDQFESVELTIVLGRYAIDWHLPESAKLSVTAAVEAWKEHWPDRIILPHPSPRNNRWLKKNPFFEQDVIPKLQNKIAELLT